MRIPIARIGLLLLLIIVLPTVFFSAYEVSNLYRNEQMVDSIYTRQLESVLFSINQYSDDVVSSWASDINDIMDGNAPQIQAGIQQFLDQHATINFIFFTDSAGRVDLYPQSSFRDSTDKYLPLIAEMIADNKSNIRRLLEYLKSDYRKIQPVEAGLPEQSLLLFGLTGNEVKQPVCGILISTSDFIAEILGPKIQSVAQETFLISVTGKADGNEIYSNDIFRGNAVNTDHKKTTWLFPHYELGIALKGETIEDLVRQRTEFNILVIILLDLVLLLAAWFIYRAIRQEVRLAQLKADFVANVSHEIRTPLAIINMYSETLQMSRIGSEEKKMEYYRVINTETNRLSAIVNKILSFSKIESGKRTYSFEVINLNEVVQHVVDTYQHHFKSKNFTCNLLIAESAMNIKADKEAITDAIINLVDNAMKYSAGNNQIDIHTGHEKNSVYLEVRDYGIGIEKKDQKLVFEKFYRVTTGNLAYKSKGSGIGLSIVKHIMDAHGGNVSLDSSPGKGSRFRLNFPITPKMQ